MAQQETEEQTSSDQPSAEEAAGRHRATDEGATDQQSTSSDDASTEQQAAPAEGKTEKQPEKQTEKQTEKQSSSPSEAKTEKQASAPAEAKTEKQQQRGEADTSWAEPETPQRRHVDVGEIAWRSGNVVATVLRTLALLFALVLIVNVVLVLVGVNPANGVAQFIGGLANLVILGFRDLFVPADPTVALIVNSLVAAVFWVFVGELVSRLIRFLAARVK